MAETIKLSFDDGYKNIELNGDPDKVIRINPTDTQFLKRIANFDVKAEEIRQKYGDIDFSIFDDLKNLDESDPDFDKLRLASENMDKLDAAMKELINGIFGYDICSIVFGEESCLSPVGGQYVCMNFMQCIFGYIAEVSKQETDKINTYSAKRKELIGTSK